MTRDGAPRDPSSHAAAGLSTAMIVEAALAAVRESGVEVLTMRGVAERLGVRAPSLYHHVGNRAALLRLVAGHAAAGFAPHMAAYETVRSVEDWIGVTRDFAHTCHRFYRDHPGLAGVVLAETSPHRDRGDDTRAAFVGAQIWSLTRLGFPESTVRHLFETGVRWTLGAIVAEEIAPAHGDDEAMFVAGFDMLLDGIRRRLEASTAS